MSGVGLDSCVAPQLELFGFAMSDAVQKTVAPKKKQGGNVVVSSLDRTKGVTSRKVTVASRESARPNPHHVSHGPFEMTAQGLIVEATRGKGKARMDLPRKAGELF